MTISSIAGYGRYGAYAHRAPATQVWAVGETVKVGFMTLRIIGKARSGDWLLTNKDGTKKYASTPHMGCRLVDSFEGV